ncbi:MAG: hypothetical protein LLG06_02540 [Desulfobacteraceae bacterium]|nr:hypothetical protein [Desulfobacteraceae bacterium]
MFSLVKSARYGISVPFSKHYYEFFGIAVFNRLRRKRLIESRSGSPSRISTLGRATIRPQFDNQGSLTC